MNIYLLDDPFQERAYRGDIALPGTGDDLLLGKGEYAVSKPIIVRHDSGGTPKDIAWTTLAGCPPLIISERLRAALEQEAIKGWKTFPVTLLNSKRKPIPDYWGLSVTGRAGAADDSKGPVVEETSPSGAVLGRFRRGLEIDLTKWDGSDFFLCANFSAIFVTDRLKDLLASLHVGNIEFRSLDEYRTPLDPF